MGKLLGIPAYNESEYLPKTLALLCQENKHTLFDELVIIDDASDDNTLQIAKESITGFHPLKSKTHFIQHVENQGKGAALVDLIRYAQHKKYQQIFMMDADLQELSYQGLSDLLESLDDGTPMSILPVYEGSRDAKEPHSIAISGTRGISMQALHHIFNTFGEKYIINIINNSRFGLEELLNHLVGAIHGIDSSIDTIMYDRYDQQHYPLARAAYLGTSPHQLQEREHIRKIITSLQKKL